MTPDNHTEKPTAAAETSPNQAQAPAKIDPVASQNAPEPTSDAAASPENNQENKGLPKKNPFDDRPAVDCSPKELVELFATIPNASCKKVHRELNRRGVKCSLNWVELKYREWEIAIAVSARVSGKAVPDLTVINTRKVSQQLAGLGSDFEPMPVLRGYQRRMLAVMSAQLGEGADPAWHKAMMEVYSAVETEMTRTYQGRKAAGAADALPETKPAPDDKVHTFTRRKA